MSHVVKEETCDIADCDKPVERSVNVKTVIETGLKLKSELLKCRRVHLCKNHYKQVKKQMKKDIPDYMG
ncbi:MAG: hypothetical protein MJZ03_01910 [archaeon]|nr:hypothetical protein [archaeon]